jgi:hypothetical protein
MGDVPYSQPGANLLDDMIERMNAQPLAFVVHVGDITSGRGPCGDEWLEARKKQFGRFKPPFVLLPGDNEWIDCKGGGFEPLERLAKWRRLFCEEVPLQNFQRQAGKYCENLRWEYSNVLFVGVNIPGAHNNAGRDVAEWRERMRAVMAWLDEAEALSRSADKPRDGLVVIMHANPFVQARGSVDGYEEIRERLARLGREMPGKVLLVHGDTHSFKDDSPLPGLRRTEVYGWPHIRWTKAAITRDGSKLSYRLSVQGLTPGTAVATP